MCIPNSALQLQNKDCCKFEVKQFKLSGDFSVISLDVT